VTDITKQFLYIIRSNKTIIGLDSNNFLKFKEKAKKNLIQFLINEKDSTQIEEEIFNKIIKYNYTNKYEVIQKVVQFFL